MTRVYLAGHGGLVGSACRRVLAASGGKYDVLVRTRSEMDLRDPAPVETFFREHRPEVVILAAGVVGGILRNRDHPAALVEDNLLLQTNVLGAARRHGSRCVVYFASSCIYPRECPQPMNEEQILQGPPEPTSLPYAIAKLAGIQTCMAFNYEDRETRFLPLIPNTVYGPGDDFGAETAHVLPALIRRFHEAHRRGLPSVAVWGGGEARRELIYADDVARAVLHVLQLDVSTLDLPMNIGTGEDRTIREIAELVREVVGFEGDIEFDDSLPEGAARKLLDGSRLANTGWMPATPFAVGLRKTYQWFLEHEGADDA